MNSKDFRLTIPVMLVLFLLMGSIFGSSEAQQARAKTITMGTIMPVSGPLGAIGLAWNRGYELAADMINEKGGINIKGEKYTISLILEDGKMSPEACSAAANKLVYQDGVKFVFGEIMEPDSEAIYNVTKKAKAFFGLAYSTVPTPLGPWGAGANNPLMVLMCTGQYLGFPIIFDYVKQGYPNLKRIVTTDNTFAHEPLIDYSIKNLKERGFDVVGVERFDLAATDYYPFITAVLKHKPEIINICMNGPEQLGRQIRAAREQGFWGPILSTCPIAPNFPLMEAGPKMATDIVCVAPYTEEANVPAEMKYVTKAWAAKYKDEFVSDALMAFDEVWALAQAIEKAQSLEPEAVVKAMESMNKKGDVKTTFGPGYFGGQTSIGANRELIRPFAISLVKDGKISNVKWATPAK